MYTLRMKLSKEYSYNEIWDLEIRIFVNAENFLQKSTLLSETHRNWVLKNPELYWGTLPKLVDHYNKNNAYLADLFMSVKSWIKKIGMNMIYFLIFKLWGYIYFQSTNSLLLFGDIDLELMKDQILLIKVLKLMIHTCLPRILQNYSPS